MADPDLQIKGRGLILKKFFRPFRRKFGLKIRGGRPHRPPLKQVFIRQRNFIPKFWNNDPPNFLLYRGQGKGAYKTKAQTVGAYPRFLSLKHA